MLVPLQDRAQSRPKQLPSIKEIEDLSLNGIQVW